MGTNTPNYNLYKPAIGETGWGADVNTSTDTVDTTLKANEDAAALNTTHRTGDGSDHADVALNTTHRTSDGSDHTFIDQDVTSGSSPTLDGTNFTNVSGVAGADVSITDSGGYYTATDVEGALQENRPLIDANTTHASGDGSDHSDVALNTTHRSSDGSDHTYIDQSVVSGASPTFDGANLTGVDAANVDIADAGAIITATDVEGALQENRTAIDLNTTHRSSTGSDHSLVNSSLVSTINFIIDGGGSAITTGIKGDVEIPFACTINQVTLLADQSTTTTIDIWKDTYANFPPTDADSITAAAVPGIAAALKDQDATLTGWTTSVTAGDILRFNVDANDNATRVTLSLKVTKT